VADVRIRNRDINQPVLHVFLDSGINSGTAPLGRPHILEPCSISGTSSTNPKSRSLEVRHNLSVSLIMNKSNKSFSLRLDPRYFRLLSTLWKNSAPSRCVTTGLNFTESDPPFVLYYCVYSCLKKFILGSVWMMIRDDCRRLTPVNMTQIYIIWKGRSRRAPIKCHPTNVAIPPNAFYASTINLFCLE
jgi:hypothetical protein